MLTPSLKDDALAVGISGRLRANRAVLAALLMLITVALYAPVAHHRFLDFDDGEYVTSNPQVSSGLRWSNVVWAFTSFAAGNWHPLTWLSHMLDCQLFGLNPGPHHLVNVALHVANVVLLFYLLFKATGAVWRSFLVAALFAVHPLNVETVAWVAERKSLLSALFSFLTIAAYGHYVRRPSCKTRIAMLAAFLLALLSKPMAVTLPIILLLLDYWPLNRYGEMQGARRWFRLAAEKWPLILMTAASCAVTILAQRSGAAVQTLQGEPIAARLANAIVSYVAYIAKTIWPAKLAVFYPLPPQQSIGKVLAAAAIVLAITALVLYFRRFGYLVTGWFVFLISLVPVIGIVQVGSQAMADRYAYLPCIGLYVMAAWALGEWADAVSKIRLAPAMAAACMVLTLAAVNRDYLGYWQNGATLFERARSVAARPHPIIELALAGELLNAGREDDALQHYQQACVLLPADPICHYDSGLILMDQHQWRAANDEFQRAATLADSEQLVFSALVNSGRALRQLGDYEEANRQFAKAEDLQRRYAEFVAERNRK